MTVALLSWVDDNGDVVKQSYQYNEWAAKRAAKRQAKNASTEKAV